jgi:hypothetical protein
LALKQTAPTKKEILRRKTDSKDFKVTKVIFSPDDAKYQIKLKEAFVAKGTTAQSVDEVYLSFWTRWDRVTERPQIRTITK